MVIYPAVWHNKIKLIWRKNIIQVVLSIQVQFLFGEQGNKQIIFREQGNKRKIILRNEAIYFRGTGADFSEKQGNRYPPGRASIINCS